MAARSSVYLDEALIFGLSQGKQVFILFWEVRLVYIWRGLFSDGAEKRTKLLFEGHKCIPSCFSFPPLPISFPLFFSCGEGGANSLNCESWL